jgi:hypothetical protein
VLKGFSSQVLKHEHLPPVVASKRERPDRPCGFELPPECILMLQSIQTARRGANRYRHLHQNGEKIPVSYPSPDREKVVLLQHLAQRISRELNHAGLSNVSEKNSNY